MTKKQSNRHDFEDRINAHAWKSPAFKKKLLADPKSALSELTGQPIPSEVSIKVIEEGKKECVIVLHPMPSRTPELSEEELRTITAASRGGFFYSVATKCPPGSSIFGC